MSWDGVLRRRCGSPLNTRRCKEEAGSVRSCPDHPSQNRAVLPPPSSESCYAYRGGCSSQSRRATVRPEPVQYSTRNTTPLVNSSSFPCSA
ncbi:hypothetical protein VTN02DRAFT_1539 [Thermoascus thermophilus]